MVEREVFLAPRSEEWTWSSGPLMLCAIAGRQPWIDRISDRFFERSFEAAFRRSVEAFRARERLGARAFGSAVYARSLDSLRDTRARALVRVERLAAGNPGVTDNLKVH